MKNKKEACAKEQNSISADSIRLHIKMKVKLFTIGNILSINKRKCMKS